MDKNKELENRVLVLTKWPSVQSIDYSLTEGGLSSKNILLASTYREAIQILGEGEFRIVAAVIDPVRDGPSPSYRKVKQTLIRQNNEVQIYRILNSWDAGDTLKELIINEDLLLTRNVGFIRPLFPSPAIKDLGKRWKKQYFS